MFSDYCHYCGTGIIQDDDGKYLDHHGLSSCPGGGTDHHQPYDVSSPGTIVKILKDRISSSTSYCAGCGDVYPSAKGHPKTQNGETISYCPKCFDLGEVFGEENGLSVSARRKTSAPSLILDCDKCGEETDPGDDNETDMFGGVGDTCENCGKGKLKLASSPDSYENSDMIEDTSESALTPDVAEDMRDATEAPRSFRAPRSMTRNQVDGLDSNGDGIYPKSHKNSSYNDIRKHLINYHKFRDDWITGYNEKDLMRVHDQAHKNCAYSVDHERPIKDYLDNTMVTSTKIAGDLVIPHPSMWGGNDSSQYPKSITLINPDNRHDWTPMDPFLRNPKGNVSTVEHQPGDFNKDTWQYKPDGMHINGHGSYEKFYGTKMGEDDTNTSLNAVVNILPVKGIGSRCKECNTKHGWKWKMSLPVQGPGFGTRFENYLGFGTNLHPAREYDENGKKSNIEGVAHTKSEAARQADLAHDKHFVQPLKESSF